MEKKKVKFDLTAVGSRLKAVRKNLNLKQKEFAEILNITAVTLSDIETGKKRPGSEIFFILSEVYHVNLNYLIRGEGDMFRPDKETKGVTIEDDLFGHYTDDVKEMLWYMQHSLLARSAIMTVVKEYLYKNEDILEKDIQRRKIKNGKKE